jgi:hypothetical protein
LPLQPSPIQPFSSAQGASATGTILAAFSAAFVSAAVSAYTFANLPASFSAAFYVYAAPSRVFLGIHKCKRSSDAAPLFRL